MALSALSTHQRSRTHAAGSLASQTLTASRNGFAGQAAWGLGAAAGAATGSLHRTNTRAPRDHLVSACMSQTRSPFSGDPDKTSPMQRAQDPARTMSSGGSTSETRHQKRAHNHICRLKNEMNRDGGGRRRAPASARKP